MLFAHRTPTQPSATTAPPGRDQIMPIEHAHAVNGRALEPPFPEAMQQAVFALGCFWGAEQLFWRLEGVFVTAVGYAGGTTRNPNYGEVCSGLTGHAEAVRVVFDPAKISYAHLLQTFWEAHDPTQGMRQGNDTGPQYRSAIYTCDPAQARMAQRSCERYQQALIAQGWGRITTEIKPLKAFYYAEDSHQQFLAKHPGGYCGLQGTGVACGASSG